MATAQLALIVLAVHSAHAEQILVDPARSIATWGPDFGWEFPGAGGSIAVAEDPRRGACVEGRFTFASESRYAGVKWYGEIPRAEAIGFWVKLADRDGGMIRIRDNTEQEHLGGLTAQRGEWVNIEVPLTKEQFGAHWGGQNDGEFHFPLRAVLIGISRGPDEGALRVSQLYAVAGEPELAERWKVAIEPGVPSGVALPGERAEYQVHILNCLRRPGEGELEIEVEQPGRKPRVLNRERVSAEAWGQVDVPVVLPTTGTGYTCLRARFSEAKGNALPAVVSGLAVVPRPRHYGEPAPDCYFGVQACPDMEAAERLGAKAVREAPGWRWAEPRRGDIRWREYLDPIIDGDTRHHMQVLLTLQAIAPEWAAWNVPDQPHLRDLPAPEQLPAWTRFVREVAARYRGKLTAIEIQNEPDLTCAYQPGLPLDEGVDYYAKLLAAGWGGVKAGDPSLAVAGIDVSGGDFDGGLHFTDAVLTHAAGKLDLYTGHPYASPRCFGPDQQPRWPGDNQMAEKCRAALDLLAKHGKPRRMWIGELGWGLQTTADPLSGYSLDFAACVAQALIVGKSVPGVEKFLWFTLAGCNEGGYEYGLLRGAPLYPLPAALAYATAAHIFDATRPVETKQAKTEVWRASFACEERDELIVAWWSDGEQALVRPPAGAPAGRWFDGFYRPLSPERLGVAVGRLPAYWVLPLKRVGERPKLLDQAGVTAPSPTTVDGVFVPSVDRLGLLLTNKTNQAQRVEIEADGGKAAIDLPPGVKRVRQEVRLPAALPVGQRREVRLVVTAGGYREVLSREVTLDRLAGPPAGFRADGDLTDWSAIPGSDLRERQTILPPDPGIGWDGPDDLSLRAYLAADSRGLYFAAAVTDDTHFAPAQDPDSFWESDSIQIALDPTNDSLAGFDADDREVGLVLGAAGPRAFISYPAPRRQMEAPLAIRRSGSQTMYEALFPWEGIGATPPVPGQVLAVNFIANDNDGRGRAYWMGLTPGIGEGKTPSAYREFVYGVGE